MSAHVNAPDLLLGMAIAASDKPSPWVLAEDAPILRVPSRPRRYQQTSFAMEYDATTIFYDCVWVERGRRAVLLGPPLLNLKQPLASMRIIAEPSGHICDFQQKTMDRHCQTWVDTPPGTTSIVVESLLGTFSSQPSGASEQAFAGKRVLLTLNKDNRMEWICDWARFHRDAHGANAILLYDNGSTSYSLAQLQRSLHALHGIDTIRIVPWNYKYGPQSWHGKYWDSDYCQLGHLEHARWRYLQTARSVMNVDIDELVLSNGRSIFETVENSPQQHVSYFGRWIVTPSGREGRPATDIEAGTGIRHKDFSYALALQRKWKQYRFFQENRCPPKWAVVPGAAPAKAQWKPHRIAGMAAETLPFNEAAYRHFREVNTNWKYKRSTTDPYDPERHLIDHELVSSMERVRWEI